MIRPLLTVSAIDMGTLLPFVILGLVMCIGYLFVSRRKRSSEFVGADAALEQALKEQLSRSAGNHPEPPATQPLSSSVESPDSTSPPKNK
jgi:hypothetical protein